MLAQLREGLAHAVRTRDVLVVVILLGATGAFGFNFSIVIPLLARYVLDSGPIGLGAMFSCLGVGAVLAALVIAKRGEATERTLLTAAASLGVVLLLVALSPWFIVTCGLMVLLGGASTAFGTTATTRMQLATPPQLRGRVMSIHSMLFMGTAPIGAFVIGILSERLGVSPTLAICAGICLFGVACASLYARGQPS